MLISVPGELFEPPAIPHALLMTIVQHVINERHRVDLDVNDGRVSTWLSLQSAQAVEEVLLAVDASARAEALTPSGTNVLLGRYDSSNFARRPILLRLEDAQTFLERPVRIVLEDAVSDANFLRKMLTEEEKSEFQRCLDKGFVEIDHGGGIGSMIRRVPRRHDQASRVRQFILFDSDALFPGMPSAQSAALETACEGVDHHQLQRRSIESYIPIPALAARAAQAGNTGKRKAASHIVDAFARLGRAQRNHFNMKSGFNGDSVRDDRTNAGNLFDGLPTEDAEILSSGFGENVADLFASGAVTEADLRDDSGWSEMRPVIQTLLAKLR